MKIVYIFSAGEMATTVGMYLHKANFKVVMVDRPQPSTVRRLISFSSVISMKTEFTVEQTIAKFCYNIEEVRACWSENKIAVAIDNDQYLLNELVPDIVIEATINKVNRLNLQINWAPLVIGLGPGLIAGQHCHVVVETNRGHDLGRLIHTGMAAENTHEPGVIEGFGKERLLRSPCAGRWKPIRELGDIVSVGDVIGHVQGREVKSQLHGIIRGLLEDGFPIERENFKVGDVDPRTDTKNLYTVTDKSRCIAGAVLLACMM